MRGARTRDALLILGPPSIIISRSSAIALSDSRAGLPRMTMLMPAHLRGMEQGGGKTCRQWRREWAKNGASLLTCRAIGQPLVGPSKAAEGKSGFTLYRTPHWRSPMCNEAMCM